MSCVTVCRLECAVREARHGGRATQGEVLVGWKHVDAEAVDRSSVESAVESAFKPAVL